MAQTTPTSVSPWGSAGNTSSAKRAGQFLFIGAITPHDPATGRLITSLDQVPEARRAQVGTLIRDVPEERALAQTWMLFKNLAQLLSEQGTSLDNLLRQRLFLVNLYDCAVVERVMDIFLPGVKPATTIVGMPAQGLNPEIAVQLDAIALVPESGGLTKETIHIPDLDYVTGRYPQATRAGQFVFVGNLYGANPKSRRLATSLSELGENADRYSNYPVRTATEEAVLAQSWFTFRHMDRILQSQGGSIADILKMNGWLRFTMRDFWALAAVRESLFTTPKSMPASTALCISGVPRDSAEMVYESIAFVPSSDTGLRKEVRGSVAATTPSYVSAVRGGPLVFTCGEVPIDQETPKAIKSFEDLSDAGRFLPYGRIHDESGYQARAWFIYNQNRSYLEEYGTSCEHVVHQTVYMEHPQYYADVERMATLFFGPNVPPTTLVSITDTSPYREARLEIELVAAVP